jgi:hypothetical protein
MAANVVDGALLGGAHPVLDLGEGLYLGGAAVQRADDHAARMRWSTERRAQLTQYRLQWKAWPALNAEVRPVALLAQNRD